MTMLAGTMLALIDLMLRPWEDELKDGTPCLFFNNDAEAEIMTIQVNKRLQEMTVFENFHGGSLVLAQDKTAAVLVLFIDKENEIALVHKNFLVSY